MQIRATAIGKELHAVRQQGTSSHSTAQWAVNQWPRYSSQARWFCNNSVAVMSNMQCTCCRLLALDTVPSLDGIYLLADSNLTGTLPASLGTALPDLQLLSLRHNPGNSTCNCAHRAVRTSASIRKSDIQTYAWLTWNTKKFRCLIQYKPSL